MFISRNAMALSRRLIIGKKWTMGLLQRSHAPHSASISDQKRWRSSESECKEKLGEKLIIRTVRDDEDLKAMIKLWEAEGMKSDLEHLQVVRDILGAEGFWMAELKGKIVGAVVNLKMNDDLGIYAGYITSAEARGKRVGATMLQQSLVWMKDHNLIADSTLVLVEMYRRYGFTPAFYDVSYAGQMNKGLLAAEPSIGLLEDGMKVVNIRDVDFRKIMELDRSHHSYSIPRTNYMYWHLFHDRSSGYAVLDGDAVVGIGARNNQLGQAFIGPIYANDPKHGEFLLHKLFTEIDDGIPCCMMVPKDNVRANDLIKSVGLTEDGEAVRVATKFHYDVNLDRFYGYTIAGYQGFALS